jgi:hypothetical protein
VTHNYGEETLPVQEAMPMGVVVGTLVLIAVALLLLWVMQKNSI